MSWVPVDFSSIRYSPIEGTHYFYDHRYPSYIQFVVNSKWESFDVSFVKHNALDGAIRLLAEEAEKRVIHESRPGYQSRPSSSVAPDSLAAHVNGHTESARSNNSQSPRSLARTPTDPRLPELQPLSTSSNATPSTPEIDPELSLPGISAAIAPSSRPAPYESPYVHTSQPKQSQASSVTASVSDHASTRLIDGFARKSPSQYGLPSDNPTLGTIPGVSTLLVSQNHAVEKHPLQSSPGSQVTLSRNRETKILLSIDGDGIRGLSSLLIVESLVNAICVKVNQRLDAHQIFDLTGGSSLGGVLAILLCRLQMQPHRARDAYKKILKQVFNNKRNFFASLGPHVPKTANDSSELEKEIKSIIHEELGTTDALLLDGRDDAGDVFVVSTHIEVGSNKAALMRSYATRRITGPELDSNMPIWQAMKATAVAPRYMPRNDSPNHTTNYRRHVFEPGLVDHGTAKNNPVRDILYECRKLFRYTNDMMIIVSIGTGAGIDRTNEMQEMVASVEDRQTEARAAGEKFEQEFRPLMERQWMKYFRFNVPGLEDVPLEEWAHEEKIKEKTSEHLKRPEVGAMFYACVDAITALLLGPPGR